MVDKFEIGDLVRTAKGLGTIQVIKKTDNGYQYLINLERDRGIYWFSDTEVFPYV